MINIRKFVKNPANALEFMCRGLERQSKRDDFVIDMSTYGNIVSFDPDNKVCSGCAATCAIQEIAGKNLTIENIIAKKRAEALKFNYIELVKFEGAINQARLGDLNRLVDFFKCGEGDTELSNTIIETGFNLGTYRKGSNQIVKIREYIEKLRNENPKWELMPIIN